MTAISSYSDSAYDSRRIPNQPPQIRNHAGLLCIRLPWGNTEDVAPLAFIDEDSPHSLREQEELERNPRSRSATLRVFEREVEE